MNHVATYADAWRPNRFCGVTTMSAVCPASRSACASERAITMCPPSTSGGLEVTTAILTADSLRAQV